MIALELNGRSALVTGAARGIGAAIARQLAQAGARVAIVDLPDPDSRCAAQQLADEICSAGGDAMALAARVDAWDEIRAAADEAASRFGRLEILVTSAGTTSRFGVDQLEPDEWTRIVAINLTGTYYTVKAVLPHMHATGSIVLIGSAAIVAGSGGGVHYAGAKAGLEGLCRGLTRELAPRGIRTNLVHPSLVDTGLLRARHPDPAVLERLAGEVPLRRLGQPDDIARLVVFLTSDLAGYITGQSIYVDGGRTLCRA
jgi:NAD(P)-dependent dehydrogenase (short-subunit alcohol dehydrogenase family)